MNTDKTVNMNMNYSIVYERDIRIHTVVRSQGACNVNYHEKNKQTL